MKKTLLATVDCGAPANNQGAAQCEVSGDDKPLRGDYYFMLKIRRKVDARIQGENYTMHVGTIHRSTNLKQSDIEVIVQPPECQTLKQFEFVVADLNEKLDCPAAVDCIIGSNEGQKWLADAEEHAVLKVSIR